MVTKTYLPSNLCDSSDSSVSNESCDSSDSSDQKIVSSKKLFTKNFFFSKKNPQKNFFTKKNLNYDETQKLKV